MSYTAHNSLLRKACLQKMHSKLYLLILKKMTSAKHEMPFNCVKNNINDFLPNIFHLHVNAKTETNFVL